MIFLDFEASKGVGGFPIEVGFCFVEPDRSLRSASMLIRHDPWLDDLSMWDAQVEADIHKISRAAVMEFGKSPSDVMTWLNAELDGMVACVDSGYDIGWMRQLAQTAEIAPTFGLSDIVAAFQDIHIDEVAYDKLARQLSSPLRYGTKRREVRGEGLRPKTHRAADDAEHLASWYATCLQQGAAVRRLYLTAGGKHELRQVQ